MTARQRTVALIGAPLLVLILGQDACSHGAPFAVVDQGTDRPFISAEPTLLTYGGGRDASWLPDGSAILYTGATSADQPDNDCLGLLPPSGGRIRRTICHRRGPAQRDSAHVLEAAAESPRGRLVYLHSSRDLSRDTFGWYPRELVLADSADPSDGRTLGRVPAFGLRTHTGVSQTRWLDERRFIYRADDDDFFFRVTTGLFIMLVEVDADPAVFMVVPGTDSATGVAVQDTDAIIYSLARDSRVYRRTLSTGQVAVLWDFGAGMEVRDVQLARTRLVAILPTTGDAGRIAVVDLDQATSRILDTGLRAWRHPALSPDGRHVVAETDDASPALYLFTIP